MSSIFLVGAGASYGSGPCYPNNPPLGKHFFDALKNQNGIASTIEESLANLFRTNFEEGMDKFFENRSPDTAEFLRNMAEYFCQFEPRPGNLYADLIHMLGNKKFSFVTTNYDLLIEISANYVGKDFTYYIETRNEGENGRIPVLKIHGSCNFLPDLGKANITGLRFLLDRDFNGACVDAGVKIAFNASEVRRFCQTQDSLAPALAMYSPSKRVLFCKSFTEKLQQDWEAELDGASRIYIIGLMVHEVDKHIWGVLAKSQCKKYYVGGEPEDFFQWAENNNVKNCFVIGRTFEEAMPTIAKHHKKKWKKL